jgi:hypothetical protein
MIPKTTINYVLTIINTIYWWRIVGRSGNITRSTYSWGLSPPPDTMTFPNFLTILT